jgi:translation elongation factor P/translation initiation factor 5A
MRLNTFCAHLFFTNVRCGPKVRKLYPFLGADKKLERVMILPINFHYLSINSSSTHYMSDDSYENNSVCAIKA